MFSPFIIRHTLAASALLIVAAPAVAGGPQAVELGPRPFFLVDEMQDGDLKTALKQCGNGPFRKRDFSIGHRGAPMQFPEHTRESYIAAARMGAGIVECDVTFTRDKQLVCRHAQNDLATTTNILATPLAEKCIKPFTPAGFDADGNRIQAAAAECRTSELTLAEFKSLRGKMDAFDANAKTVEEFMGGTANWRTDLYSGPTSGTLMTHAESIALFKELGVKMTPELKSASVAMPFDSDGDGVGDYTQDAYAQQMIDEYKALGVRPRNVWAQSFDIGDIRYWITNEPAFGRQAVYLDDAETPAELPDAAELAGYKGEGINIVAPPMFALLDVDSTGQIVPSTYAQNARDAGLDIITWTIERSGILADGSNGFYYQTIDSAIHREGDMMTVLDVLAKQVGILGIFSDWPATTSYYANCMNLK
ncbi:MAG: glycerophosphodiester phosphodiesterase [Hydrogenophilales bacterium 16-64-46]|nr:MAG: glycerophosphodiester phosphodiesterase [Hydrogenophilales bacterium 12-64-13]OYZ04732.1 MAG: glycerophosphodiester phosphodiesterase [Hydrogenophilales bacterium 16-64-46]OZA38418.1 MAG: glycerophosphodiester phosphodiesterase [Hydrogenophilales bacterium 17-64-34]HQS99777.1 glycerophosphodiester phosphodiesterase family protein [Thiobacillus sp.]